MRLSSWSWRWKSLPRWRKTIRLDEAMTAAKKAVEHYRGLAVERSSTFFPELAGSLNTLAMRHNEIGQTREALAAYRASESIFRELADDLPDSFLPDYAMCLTNLGTLLSRAELLDEALFVSEKAIALYRPLAARQRGAFAGAHAVALTNASQLFGVAGRWDEALLHSQEAVAILRCLSEEHPQARTDLAEALDTLSRNLSQSASPQESLSAIEEALALRRELAAKSPEISEPRLAGSLGNYALRLTEFDRHVEALRAISEAIRRLTPTFPGTQTGIVVG
jgi:tetratricopeptide (TPR) repeat protein